MNKVILKGKFTRDPEIKYTQSSKAYAKFSLAVQQNFKNDKGEYGADFINCAAWDKKAEIIGEYFRKGSNILVEGRLSVRQYEDENKQKRTITEVLVESLEFIDRANKQESSDSSNANDLYGGGTASTSGSSGDDEFPF